MEDGGMGFPRVQILQAFHLTPAATYNMDMGTDGLFKEAGNQKLFFTEDSAAYGAYAAAVAFQAVAAAGNMHQAVIAAKGRESRRLNPLTIFQPCTADRAGTGRSGKAFAFGLFQAAAFSLKDRHGKAAGEGKKQGKAKIQQQHANDDHC